MRSVHTVFVMLGLFAPLGCSRIDKEPVEDAVPMETQAPDPRATAAIKALIGVDPSESELRDALAILDEPTQDKRWPDSTVEAADDEGGGDRGEGEPAPELPAPSWYEQLEGLDLLVVRSLLASKAAEAAYTPKGINGRIDDRYDPTELLVSLGSDSVYAKQTTIDLEATSAVALMLFRPASKKPLRWSAAPTLRERGLCPDQRFANDRSYKPACTAVLVAPNVVATAGHCVSHANNEDIWFVFGYDRRTPVNVGGLVPQKDAYRGVELIKESSDDWALIKLDRPVVGRRPVEIRESSDLVLGEYVFAAGHPNGIPLTFVQSGAVLTKTGTRFSTNLDLFEGNSGSPVFDRSHQPRRMVGLVVSGRKDYDDMGPCFVVAHCILETCQPEEVSVNADLMLPYLRPYLRPRF